MSARDPAARPRASATFFVVAIAQALSLFGTGLTAFAVGVWMFERSGSATDFGLFGLSATIPIVVTSPFVGVLIDRLTPRRAMVLGQAAAGAGTLVLAVVASGSGASIGATCALVCAISVCESLAWTAYIAAIEGMVPARHLERANGLVQLGDAAASILAPIGAAALMGHLPLGGVLVCDAVTSFVAALAIAATAPRLIARGPSAHRRLADELLEAVRFLGDRPGLCALATVFTIGNFATSALQALAPPLVLSIAGRGSAAVVRSLAGVGMVVGGVAATVLPGPVRKARATVAWTVLRGVVFVAGAMRPSVATMAAVSLVTAVSFAPMMSASQAIWQRAVPSSMQGRVFALRRMLATASVPLAYGAMGPLADRVGTALVLGVVGAATGLVALALGLTASMRALDVEIVGSDGAGRRDLRHAGASATAGQG